MSQHHCITTELRDPAALASMPHGHAPSIPHSFSRMIKGPSRQRHCLKQLYLQPRARPSKPCPRQLDVPYPPLLTSPQAAVLHAVGVAVGAVAGEVHAAVASRAIAHAQARIPSPLRAPPRILRMGASLIFPFSLKTPFPSHAAGDAARNVEEHPVVAQHAPLT